MDRDHLSAHAERLRELHHSDALLGLLAQVVELRDLVYGCGLG